MILYIYIYIYCIYVVLLGARLFLDLCNHVGTGRSVHVARVFVYICECGYAGV